MPNPRSDYVETALSGYELLNDPLLNKGTAFTEDERDAFDLHGLLPPHVAELDFQAKRRHAAFHGLGSDLQRYDGYSDWEVGALHRLRRTASGRHLADTA